MILSHFSGHYFINIPVNIKEKGGGAFPWAKTEEIDEEFIT